MVFKVANKIAPLENRENSVGIKKQTEEPSLKGAFVSVLFLGGFIFLSWMGVYYLFISR
jgi:hypothetical protein